MDVYNAILKAADQIEKYPDHFHFIENRVPRTCDSPGCAIGWIAHFANTRANGYTDASQEMFGMSPEGFYQRMTEVEGRGPYWTSGRWPHNAVKCASTLRLYAAKFHAPAEPALHPGYIKLRNSLEVTAALRETA